MGWFDTLNLRSGFYIPLPGKTFRIRLVKLFSEVVDEGESGMSFACPNNVETDSNVLGSLKIAYLRLCL